MESIGEIINAHLVNFKNPQKTILERDTDLVFGTMEIFL